MVFKKKSKDVPMPGPEMEVKTSTKELNVDHEGRDAKIVKDNGPEMIKVHPELQPTLDYVSDRFAGVFQTPLSSDVVQRDETNTLLLAILHEQIKTNRLLQEAIDKDQ